MNHDELRAAADVFLGPQDTSQSMASFYSAANTLARHVQRMYDETPVDEAWLLSVGARRQYYSLFIGAVELDFSSLPAAVWMYVGGKGIKKNPTRGDVRRLCEALGIKLREGE